MNKALIVGPNVGVSMGHGGGVRVATKMAEALAENDFMVSLCAFRGYPLEYLDSIHNTQLSKYGNRVRTDYLITTPRSQNDRISRLSGVLPIHVGVFPFSLYLQKVIREFSPNFLIFHDDIPRLAKGRLRKRLTVLYVHFSYATRLKLGVGDIAETVAPSREFLEKLLNPLLGRLIFLDSTPADVVIANSSITAAFLRQTWDRREIVILHPPVDTRLYGSLQKKENLTVCVGTIQPNKRFEDVIKAMSMVDSECQLVIIGHFHQSEYYRKLVKLVSSTGQNNRIKVILDASRRQVEDILSRAKIIVHASRFEPFGISVVEGMASGCVPLVYKGTTSGPWIDIVNKGEFGIGFGTIEELSGKIQDLLSDEKMCASYRLRARRRSEEFDTAAFKARFTKMLRRIN